MQVKDVMIHQYKLVSASPFETVKNAMEKMVKHKVGSVIVTQVENKAIGIITNQDIMIEMLRSGIEGLETTLNKIMSTNLITVNELESLNNAIIILEESSTHHLIVIAERGHVVGILSSLDIVRERAYDIKASSNP